MTTNELDAFRRGLQAYDEGVAQVWRTLNDLIRAGVDDATLRLVIEDHAADASKQQPARRRDTQPADH